MKSRWLVANNVIDTAAAYRLYRLIDTAEPDHAGNREYYNSLLTSEHDAQVAADRLNAEDIKHEIRAAVIALGYSKFVSIDIKEVEIDRYYVVINNGEMVCIYDSVKRTFVD